MGNESAGQERESHSFIVKVWIEETMAEAGHVVWRGSISHIPDAARRYFIDLETMADFVGDFVERMGGDAGLSYRLRKKVRHFQRRFHDHS